MTELNEVRIDKWLWAARFYKTRSLATQAVEGGKVHLAGNRVKPARSVKIGDTVTVTTEHGHFEVVIEGLSDKRGPAPVAQALYRETETSKTRREQEALQRQLAPSFDEGGRPTKRDRRDLGKFRGY